MRTFTTTIAGLLALAVAFTSSMAWADRDRDRGHRKHDHDRSNVSVHVNVAPRAYGRHYRSQRDYAFRPHRSPSSGWNYGVGVGSYGSQVFLNSWSNGWTNGWSDPWSRRDYYERRPVVIEKNIYIQHATPERRVTTRTISSSRTSLFRDRYGRCYEREVDGFGNETRIELDAAECNF